MTMILRTRCGCERRIECRQFLPVFRLPLISLHPLDAWMVAWAENSARAPNVSVRVFRYDHRLAEDVALYREEA